MLRPALTAALIVSLASPAAALSCIAPSVQSSFQAASEAEATYALAVGQITVLPGQDDIPPPPADPNEREDYILETRFQGNLVSLTGFDQPADFNLRVEVDCAGPWCGLVPRDEVLVFVERRDGANVLTQGPCPQFALTATEETVAGALSCLRGEGCEAPN